MSLTKPGVIVGGDPELIRKMLRTNPGMAQVYARSEASRSIEVPCQRCGRGVLIAPSGQSIALGDPTPVCELKTDEKGALDFGPSEIATGGAAVLCMWCAFADAPEILAKLNAAMGSEDTRSKL